MLKEIGKTQAGSCLEGICKTVNLSFIGLNG